MRGTARRARHWLRAWRMLHDKYTRQVATGDGGGFTRREGQRERAQRAEQHASRLNSSHTTALREPTGCATAQFIRFMTCACTVSSPHVSLARGGSRCAFPRTSLRWPSQSVPPFSQPPLACLARSEKAYPGGSDRLAGSGTVLCDGVRASLSVCVGRDRR